VNALEHLKAARALIATPDKWCKVYLTDAGGRHCMIGALEAVGRGWPAARAALMAANNIDSVILFNDDSTHEQVLAAFDKAIAYLTPRPTDISIFQRILERPDMEIVS
jgi:hypothetical protein